MRAGEQIFERFAAGHVDRAVVGVAAEFFERFDAGLAAFVGQIGDDHLRAGLRQARTKRAAQHARPADDDRRLTLETEELFEIGV